VKDGNLHLNSDFLFRLICYNNIRKIINGNYRSNLDVFGGVGITAKLFSQRDEWTFVNEIDPVCRTILRINFPIANVIQKDVLKETFIENFDLVLADFNDFTIGRFLNGNYKNVLDNIFRISQRYVIINDCSIYTLKYKRGDIKNAEELFTKEKKIFEDRYPGWRLTHIEYFCNSSFLLFEQGSTREFSANKVTSNKEQIITCTL